MSNRIFVADDDLDHVIHVLVVKAKAEKKRLVAETADVRKPEIRRMLASSLIISTWSRSSTHKTRRHAEFLGIIRKNRHARSLFLARPAALLNNVCWPARSSADVIHSWGNRF